MKDHKNTVIARELARAAVLAGLLRAEKPMPAAELAEQTGLSVCTVGNTLRSLAVIGRAKLVAKRTNSRDCSLWIAVDVPVPAQIPAACPKGLEPADLEWMAYWRARAAQRAARRAGA